MSTQDMPVVAAVIVNWNGREHLRRCLESIESLDYPKKRRQLIVVDNGSTDGSQEMVKAFLVKRCRGYLKSSLIELPRNIGAPAAMNRGLEEVHPSAEFVWKLDNDVQFGAEYLRILIEPMLSEKGVGAVGGRLIDTVGHEQPSHAVLRKPPRLWGSMLKYQVVNTLSWCQTDVIIGSSCLFRKDVFKSQGVFKEHFFLYYDDTEYCLRLRMHGWKLVVNPSATALHLGCSSVGKGTRTRLRYMTRNKLLLGRTIFSGRSRAMFILVQILGLPWFALRTVREYSALPLPVVIGELFSSYVLGLTERVTDA